MLIVKSTGAPHSKEKGLIAPTSNSSSICCFTNNYSYELWQHSPFYTGSVPSSRGIECISLSFLFGGTYFNFSGRPVYWSFFACHKAACCFPGLTNELYGVKWAWIGCPLVFLRQAVVFSLSIHGILVVMISVALRWFWSVFSIVSWLF